MTYRVGASVDVQLGNGTRVQNAFAGVITVNVDNIEPEFTADSGVESQKWFHLVYRYSKLRHSLHINNHQAFDHEIPLSLGSRCFQAPTLPSDEPVCVKNGKWVNISQTNHSTKR